MCYSLVHLDNAVLIYKLWTSVRGTARMLVAPPSLRRTMFPERLDPIVIQTT